MWREMVQTSRGISSGRVGFLFVVAFSNVVFWVMWIIFCFVEGKLAQVPSGIVEVYAIANGAAFVGKAGQSWADRNKGGNDDKPTGKAKKYIDKS